MRIGIPKEIKVQEGRVALTPAACAELIARGQEVTVQSTAGIYAGYRDEHYISVGCTMLEEAKTLYQQSDLIVKVKEPQPIEVEWLRPDQRLFSFLHLAAEPELTRLLLDSGTTAIGFETILENGEIPILAPMSDIAGRISVQIGTNLLQHQHQGRGVLLGGVAGTERGEVVILGAGVAGGNAAVMAQGMGANVTIFDLNRNKLDKMRSLGPNVTALHADQQTIESYVKNADLLIGAILIPGAKTPIIVSETLVAQMHKGSVAIDISVDQGGCIETIHPTSYANPTYIVNDVIHCGVTNLPGAVPRTSSQALSASLLPYILRLIRDNWQNDQVLVDAINVQAGKIVHPALK